MVTTLDFNAIAFAIGHYSQSTIDRRFHCLTYNARIFEITRR